MPRMLPYGEYIEYDGTNSADVLDFANDHDTYTWTIQSETGGILTLHTEDGDAPYSYALSVGDFGGAQAGKHMAAFSGISAAEFALLYIKEADLP